MFERSLARGVAVIGVGHDCADQFFGIASFAQDLRAFGRMPLIGKVFGVRPALVIKIVKQGSESPKFFVGAGFARVGADAGFYGEHVLAQRFGFCVFADKIPSVFAGWQEKFLRLDSKHYWSTGGEWSPSFRAVGLAIMPGRMERWNGQRQEPANVGG